MPDTRQPLRQLFTDGKTGQVIERLLLMTFGDRDQHNEVLQLSAQFAELERQTRLNITDPKLLSVERNRINGALLAIMDRFPENRHPLKRLWNLKKISIWLSIFVTIAGIIGYTLRDIFKKTELPITLEPKNPGPFPDKFDSTTLYILISRFEDYANGGETECYGRGIESSRLPTSSLNICSYVYRIFGLAVRLLRFRRQAVGQTSQRYGSGPRRTSWAEHPTSAPTTFEGQGCIPIFFPISASNTICC